MKREFKELKEKIFNSNFFNNQKVYILNNHPRIKDINEKNKPYDVLESFEELEQIFIKCLQINNEKSAA